MSTSKKNTTKTSKVIKKSVKKITKKKALVHVEDQRCFWVHNGPVLSNLRDLADALEEMTEKTYAHHVRKDGNDFVSWVAGVLKDTDVADKIAKSKKPQTARKVVVAALKQYGIN